MLRRQFSDLVVQVTNYCKIVGKNELAKKGKLVWRRADGDTGKPVKFVRNVKQCHSLGNDIRNPSTQSHRTGPNTGNSRSDNR